jgi:hypothetical protein
LTVKPRATKATPAKKYRRRPVSARRTNSAKAVTMNIATSGSPRMNRE